MKRIVKKENILKGAGVLLIVLVLLFSNLSVTANNAMVTSTQTIQTTKPSYKTLPTSGGGAKIILEENFTDGNMPPVGWELNQTNQNETWYIDGTFPHSEPYCGTVHRGNDVELQDEWLITPSLNFGAYDEIALSFWWYTHQYTSQEADYIDLNVSISTDGGSTWDPIWNEDDLGDFFSWKWYDTNFDEHIDLSIYAGETDVKIGFQYCSNSLEYMYAQEFSIDDIIVYGAGDDFECSPGVPYEISWDWNNFYGVKFHGDAINGDPPYLDWLWDFGDNHTSKLPYFPTHRFDKPGLYNISLTVKDLTDHVAFNHTTVLIIVMPPPEIEIDIQGGFGINAQITNGGNLNVTYIHWKIIVQWGPFKMFENEVANGTIVNLEAKSSQPIDSGYFIGFGRIIIKIIAEPENAMGDEEQQRAFKIGPFVFGVHT